jgi:hypothetical protein
MSTGAPAPEDKDPMPAKRMASWFDRALWLGRRVAEARATAFTAGQPGFALYDVAREMRDEAARITRAGRGKWVVPMLDCMAIELLVRAHLARAGTAVARAPLGEAEWATVRQLPSVHAAWENFPSTHMATLMALIGGDRVVALTELSDEERGSVARKLRDLVGALIAPLEWEANRLGWALVARWSRIAVVGLLLLALVGFAASWVSSRNHPNLALHRPVLASSLNGYGPEPGRLVDGIIDEIAFHTNGGDQQWVVIDLGEVKKFDKIVVYNRPDCCAERAVPLKVEVSNDNQNFTPIAERTEVFAKWSAKNLHAEGRYLRLKNTPPNFFHLAEVEVY